MKAIRAWTSDNRIRDKNTIDECVSKHVLLFKDRGRFQVSRFISYDILLGENFFFAFQLILNTCTNNISVELSESFFPNFFWEKISFLFLSYIICAPSFRLTLKSFTPDISVKTASFEPNYDKNMTCLLSLYFTRYNTVLGRKEELAWREQNE